MSTCEYYAVCPFFAGRIAAEPDLVRLLKDIYCHGKHHDCARLLATKIVGDDNVPDDLMPHDAARLYRMVGEGPELTLLTQHERLVLRRAASR